MKDGSVLHADLIIFCTGFYLNYSFLEEKVRKIISFDDADDYMPYLLDRSTFHPDLPTLAFCTGIKLYIHPMELQARWASMVFSKKISLPSREKMLQGIEIEKKIKEERAFEFPYNDTWDWSDSVAKEIGALPDLEIIEKKDPELYEALWKGPYLASHYRLNGFGENFSIASNTIKEVYQNLYKFFSTY